MTKLKPIPLANPKWPVLVQVPLDDDTVLDQIKMFVTDGNVESSAGKLLSIIKKDNKDSNYTTYGNVDSVVYYGSGYGM